MFKITASQQNIFTKIIILTIAALGFSLSYPLFAHFNLALTNHSSRPLTLNSSVRLPKNANYAI